MRALFCYLTALVALVAGLGAWGKPVGGARTLVVLEKLEDKTEFGTFLKSLEDRGHRLSFKSASEDDFGLVAYEERRFDHFLVLAPAVATFGGQLGVGNVLDFIDKGGNVLVATSSDISDAIRDLTYEFSADFDEAGSAVIDHFHAVNDDHTLIAASDFIGNDVAVPPVVKQGPPVLFRGVAHRLTGKNPLAQPLLVGAPTAYSYEANDQNPVEVNLIVGKEVVLVSSLQARNNARVVFAGSVDMFSDKLIDAPVKSGDKQHQKSGNLPFITALSKWVFQETGVLNVNSKKHHRENETAQHGIYRIKDDMVFEITISEWRDGEWHPFTPTDMQFEAVMLDPYIRTNLVPQQSGTLTAHFKLPDHYGVFIFKVDYKRHGYSYIHEAETVQIRPFRHDQYPRFLSPAWPYYVNVFSLMVAFVLFSGVFLWNRDVGSKVKVKTT
ncbi:dolichyl-diphosphooligosaccharide---protein glycotransferase [Spizellomyces sp. 'palustris']|nr:dolichyl-diphosphooligosaccharide---protein glycotransferase [Spizellomyces sp. 'palustris']